MKASKPIPPPFASFRVSLKSWLRSNVTRASTLTGIAYLWRTLVARRGVRILMYHGVETPPSSPLAVSVENFENQMAHIARRYDVIDLPTFLKWKRGEYQSGRPKVIVTFDDGFENVFNFAAPILERYRVAGTFFLIASKLDGHDDRFMTAQEAVALSASGLFNIGSHSLSHRSMARIPDTERREEMGVSKAVLEAALGRPVNFFCFPYGTFNDFDQPSIDELKRCGYVLACTSINGVNFKGTDPFRLRRTKVEWSDDLETFARTLDGALDGWFLVDYFLRFLQRPRAVKFGSAHDNGQR